MEAPTTTEARRREASVEDSEKRDILESAASMLGNCFNWTMFRSGEECMPNDPIIFAGLDTYRALLRERPDPTRLLMLMQLMTGVINLKWKGHPAYSDPFVAARDITDAVRRKEADGKVIPFPSSR
jgi:hypothetical protein